MISNSSTAVRFVRYHCIPLFCVPQTSHSIYFLRPVFWSSRLPQSVQKTREPIAAMTLMITISSVTRPFKRLKSFTASEGSERAEMHSEASNGQTLGSEQLLPARFARARSAAGVRVNGSGRKWVTACHKWHGPLLATSRDETSCHKRISTLALYMKE